MNPKIKINYTIPLGFRCPTALTLRRLDVRRCSYPFDWTLLTHLEPIICSLKDDFSTVLDRSQYIDYMEGGQYKGNKKRHNACGHASLPNCGGIFRHRDMRRDGNYEYLNRCVDRFRATLKKEHPKLFVIGQYFNWIDYPKFEEDVRRVNDALSSLTQNYYVLAMTHIFDKKNPRVEYTRTDNVFFADLFTRQHLDRKGGGWLKHKRDRDREARFIKSLFDFEIIDDVGVDEERGT